MYVCMQVYYVHVVDKWQYIVISLTCMGIVTWERHPGMCRAQVLSFDDSNCERPSKLSTSPTLDLNNFACSRCGGSGELLCCDTYVASVFPVVFTQLTTATCRHRALTRPTSMCVRVYYVHVRMSQVSKDVPHGVRRAVRGAARRMVLLRVQEEE